MKTALYLALCGAALCASRAHAEAFADADKALWIDRHNYFRMSALPFSAGNMLRIKWSDDLATQAQADATACAVKTAPGVNAAVVAATGSAVDAAFQVWVVDAAMGVFPKLTAPKAAGEPVGTGNYNSYSQVVWAATNQVGCAKAACGAQVGVACRYAPAGNDGASPWYVHAATGTACPDGLVSKVGLCVTSADDPAYNDIAPIPAGQQSYEVFKDFIPNMQKALKGEAVAPAAATPAASAAADAKAAATPAAPAADGASAAPAASAAPGASPASAAPGASAAPAASTAPGASAAPAATDAKTSTAPAASGTPATGGATTDATPEPVVTKIVDGKVLVRVKKTAAPATGAGSAAGAAATNATTTPSVAPTDASATPEPMVTKVVNGQVLVRVKKTTAPAAGAGSAAGAATGPSVGDDTPAPEPSVTKVVDGKVYVRVPKGQNAVSNDVVGTVKPSDSTGTTFTNQATTAPAGAAATTPAAAASTTTTAPAPAAASAAGASATGANNKSGEVEQAAGFSAAGVAGVIVIGCVAVAGIAVFVSYRKNQQRQRDIMQNGGIHVL